MRSEVLSLHAPGRGMLDITGDVRHFVSGTGDGLVSVFAPHATVGLAIMETGSGSESDLESILDAVLPRDRRYVHSHGSTGHGADHVLPAFLSPSVTIPVLGGDLQLGTWQSVVVVDLNVDNTERKVRLSFLEG